MPTIVEIVMFPATVEGVKELSDTGNDHKPTYFKMGIKIPNIDHEYFNISPLSIFYLWESREFDKVYCKWLCRVLKTCPFLHLLYI